MTSPQCPESDLSCPEPGNYAAIAKQLHETALEVEGRLFCLEQLLRGAVNLPAFMQTSTLATSSILPNSTTQINTTITVFTTNFQNSTFSVNSTTPETALPEGVYHFGVYINATPTGAVTANSYRLLRIATRENINGVPTQYTLGDKLTYETSSGNGGDMTVTAVARMNGFQSVVFEFQHGNSGSNMTIASGMIMYAIRISDSTTLQVVN